MAELVAAIGVPHSPHYPSQYPKDGPDSTSQTYRAVKAHLDAAKPDAIVVIANDHFNTFFLNNFPTFAIGVAETSSGPNDQTRMPHYDFAVHVRARLARAQGRHGRGLRFRRDAGFRRRSRHAGAAALPDRRREDSGGADLGQRVRQAAAAGAPLPCARQDAEGRDRQPAARHAGRDPGDRALLAGNRRPPGRSRRPATARPTSAGRSMCTAGSRTPRSTSSWRRRRRSRCGRPATSAASC